MRLLTNHSLAIKALERDLETINKSISEKETAVPYDELMLKEQYESIIAMAKIYDESIKKMCNTNK